MIAAGIERAADQCRELLEAGVPGLQFDTLNTSRFAATIVCNLGDALRAPTGGR